MKGLKGRPVLQLDPDQKDLVQRFATRCDDWKDRQKTTCAQCLREWWKPKVIETPGTDRCPNCCTHSLIRGYMLKSNGEACPQALCIYCGKRGDISRRDMRPVLDVILRNNLTDDHWRADALCTHCGRRGAELHHWAPRAIFNDADSWPMSWLCPDCHRLWHSTMRKAAGYRLPESERPGERPAWWGGATA